MIDAIVSAGIGLIGVALGAWINSRSTAKLHGKRERRAATIALWQEFNSTDMIKFRRLLDLVLQRMPDRNMATLYPQMTDPEQVAFSVVVHFFQRIAGLEKHGLLDTEQSKVLWVR